MIVEISTLPVLIQKALIQGEHINFTNHGKIIAHVVNDIPNENNQTLYEWAMAYDGVDVSDIEFDDVQPVHSRNRWLEFD